MVRLILNTERIAGLNLGVNKPNSDGDVPDLGWLPHRGDLGRVAQQSLSVAKGLVAPQLSQEPVGMDANSLCIHSLPSYTRINRV